jgi:hypothetical protein
MFFDDVCATDALNFCKWRHYWKKKIRKCRRRLRVAALLSCTNGGISGRKKSANAAVMYVWRHYW